MSNNFWNFTNTLTAGTLAKAEDVNDNFGGVAAGLDLIETEINKCIQLTNLEGKTIDIADNAAARANKVVSFDASGNVIASVSIGTWQDDWAAQEYNVRDIVKDAAGDVGLNNIYMCNTAHTGTDLSTQISFWDLVIDLTDVVTSETNAAASASAADSSATAASGSATTASGHATTASNWAQLITAFVSGSDNSAKSWAIGGTGDGDPTGGSAKDWATKATIVDAEYSAKSYASNSAELISTGSAKEWASKTDAVVDTEYSAKVYAQDTTLGGSNTGGSAKEWAQEAEDSDITGSTEYSALHHAAKAAASAAAFSLPKNHIAGLILSNGTDTDHDIDITVGECRNNDNTEDIVLSSALTKQLDVTWSAGTNAGGLSSSLTAPAVDTWYHVFLVKIAGSVDVLFDTSLTCANGVTDHTVTKFRRIGSVLTDGSANILQFIQIGDHFDYVTPFEDVNVSNQGTSPINYTISTPLGLKTIAKFRARTKRGSAGAVYVLIYDPDITAQNPTSTGAPLWNVGGLVGTGAGLWAVQLEIRTNTSSQVAADADSASTDLDITITGYIDTRGRD